MYYSVFYLTSEKYLNIPTIITIPLFNMNKKKLVFPSIYLHMNQYYICVQTI